MKVYLKKMRQTKKGYKKVIYIMKQSVTLLLVYAPYNFILLLMKQLFSI